MLFGINEFLFEKLYTDWNWSWSTSSSSEKCYQIFFKIITVSNNRTYTPIKGSNITIKDNLRLAFLGHILIKMYVLSFVQQVNLLMARRKGQHHTPEFMKTAPYHSNILKPVKISNLDKRYIFSKCYQRRN